MRSSVGAAESQPIFQEPGRSWYVAEYPVVVPHQVRGTPMSDLHFNTAVRFRPRPLDREAPFEATVVAFAEQPILVVRLGLASLHPRKETDYLESAPDSQLSRIDVLSYAELLQSLLQPELTLTFLADPQRFESFFLPLFRRGLRRND